MTDVRSSAVMTTSNLRRPEVLRSAYEHPLIVRVPGHDDPLVVMPQATLDLMRRVGELTELFLRATVEHGRSDPSPVGLGRVRFFLDWDAERRVAFLRGLAEALSAAIEDNDPVPADAYIDLMSRADEVVTAPGVLGEMTQDATDWVTARIASRES